MYSSGCTSMTLMVGMTGLVDEVGEEYKVRIRLFWKDGGGGHYSGYTGGESAIKSLLQDLRIGQW